MAFKTDRSRDREQDPAPKHGGDVIGISDADTSTTIPTANRGGGHPKGIDVRDRATGIGDVPQRSGATGIDMGGGGEGTDVDPNSKKPHSAEDQDE